MFFDWKIQLEKAQLTRDLNDNTKIYQGTRLPCKDDQGYCDPITRTQATIVWFPEDTCTTFQIAKIHARMIKFHQKNFIESIPFEEINQDQTRQTNHKFRNIHKVENKLTRFRIFQETELASKYRNPLYKTQYSEILVPKRTRFRCKHCRNNTGSPRYTSFLSEGTSYIPLNLLRYAGNTRGKIKPQDTQSTRLQKLSLMSNHTISRIFQEMSFSELETLHQLCEQERTQILQSLAVAVPKSPYAGYLLSVIRSNFLDYEGNVLWFYTCTKKVSPSYVFEDKQC